MTLYCIKINIAHVFNFRTSQAIRIYFNNKIFATYSTYVFAKHLSQLNYQHKCLQLMDKLTNKPNGLESAQSYPYCSHQLCCLSEEI